VSVTLVERAVEGEQNWPATWMRSIKEGGIYLIRCRAARVVLSQLTMVKSTVVAFSIVVIVAGLLHGGQIIVVGI
jgi:hypothetical protein